MAQQDKLKFLSNVEFAGTIEANDIIVDNKNIVNVINEASYLATGANEIAEDAVQNANDAIRMANDAVDIAISSTDRRAFKTKADMDAWIESKKLTPEEMTIPIGTFVNAGDRICVSMDLELVTVTIDGVEQQVIANHPTGTPTLYDISGALVEVSWTDFYVENSRYVIPSEHLEYGFEIANIDISGVGFAFNGDGSTEGKNIRVAVYNGDSLTDFSYEHIKTHHIAVGTQFYVEEPTTTKYWWNGIAAVLDESNGGSNAPEVSIVQTTGDSETAVMSQKAVTEAINVTQIAVENVKENFDACTTVDFGNNIMPLASVVGNTYENSGVTITVDEYGVFTLNGTAVAAPSIEITTKGEKFATLASGSYTAILKYIGGTIEGTDRIFAYYGSPSSGTLFAPSTKGNVVKKIEEETDLTRFALTLGKAGAVFTDFKIIPYLSLTDEVDTKYDGGTRMLNGDSIKWGKNFTSVEDFTMQDFGNNLLPLSHVVGKTYISNNVTISIGNDGVFELNGTCSYATGSGATVKITTDVPFVLPAGRITGSMQYVGGEYIDPDGVTTNAAAISVGDNPANGGALVGGSVKRTYTYDLTEDATTMRFNIVIYGGVTYNNYKIVPYVAFEEHFDTDYIGATTKLNRDVVSDDSRLKSVLLDECKRVVDEAVIKEADLKFVVFADPHSMDVDKYKKYKTMMEYGNFDFLLGLGDYLPYASATRVPLMQHINEMLSYSGRNHNTFYCIGNHDAERIDKQKDNFQSVGRHLNGSVVFNEEDPYGCYYYVDYDAAKIRVVVLNTSDEYDEHNVYHKYKGSIMMQERQTKWFAEKALNFENKSISTDWSVIVSCHIYNPFYYGVEAAATEPLFEILKAAKNGSTLDKSYDVQRRVTYNEETGKYTNTIDTSHTDSISVNVDYSKQGPINIMGILYGHNHNTHYSVINEIPVIGFLSDSKHIDDTYIASVDGLTVGTYYIEPFSGNKWGFEITEAQANENVKYVRFNAYFNSSASQSLRFLDENKNILFSRNATANVSEDGRTELVTGFVKERIEGTPLTESCSIVCIDKDARNIHIIPYGLEVHRDITY